MARLARIVVPGMPHHVTQRGNRRQQTFFCDDDYRAYLSLLVEWCRRYDTRVWAYCLKTVGKLLGRDLLPKRPGRKAKGRDGNGDNGRT